MGTKERTGVGEQGRCLACVGVGVGDAMALLMMHVACLAWLGLRVESYQDTKYTMHHVPRMSILPRAVFPYTNVDMGE